MKEFQISRYIKKWLPLIIVACIVMTAAVYLFLSFSQSYVASAVIRFNNENAVEGKNPDGSDLDVNSIKASSIMSQVINNLELDQNLYSVDSLISRIQITEVIDEDEQERKDALLELGEEYTYEPTTFIVSFEATNSEGREFAGKVLDELLDVYFSDYSELYINSASTVNSISEIYDSNYDYIEMVELINDNIGDTVNTLSSRISNNSTFRSATTGYSFTDLATEFNYIKSVKISELFSQIFKYQITKDKDLLISKYNERIKENGLAGSEAQKKIDDVLELMDLYVEKMRESGNTNITSEYILDEVHNRDLTDIYGELVGNGAQTVTYDKLIYSWRDNKDTDTYTVIDSAYCRYVLNEFNRCTGADSPAPIVSEVSAASVDGTGTDTAAQTEADAAGSFLNREIEENTSPCADSDLTCAALNTPGYDGIVEEVQNEIRSLLAELDELYRIVEATNTEYNEYLGAANISTLSTSSVNGTINVALYTGLAAVFFLVICCCGAVLLGRLNDIIRYVFYMDHFVEMNNRIAFDNYIKTSGRKLLSNDTACIMIAIKNQRMINNQFGRDSGDKLIKFFADNIKETFGEEGSYIAYNGNAQFFVIEKSMQMPQAQKLLEYFKLIVDKRELLREAEIEYEMGLAHAGQEGIHRIRSLVSKAVANRKNYVSKPGD